MSTELIAISGLGVTIIRVGVALAGLILKGQNNLRKEMGGLRAEVNGLRGEINVLRGEINVLRKKLMVCGNVWRIWEDCSRACAKH